MKKVLLALLLIFNSAMAQYDLQWYSIYDNPHPSYNDYAVDLVEDISGNIYVTGTSFQIDLDDWRYDFATIKYNSNGDSLWVRRYDSSIGNESEDQAVAIGIDKHNNIYVSGNSWSPRLRVTIIKYDVNGNELWIRIYSDSLLSQRIMVNDMEIDNEGNVFLVCSDYVNPKGSEIVKYNSNGEIEWIGKYLRGPNDVNGLISMDIDNLGNIYAAGYAKDSGSASSDFLTVKFNQQGVLQWSTITDQTAGDRAHDVKADNSGNVFAAGYSKNQNNLYDFKILKFNSYGEKQWVSSYAGRSEIDLFGDYERKKMIETDNNGNIYTDFISYSSGNNDIATAKFNSSGDLVWVNLYDIGGTDITSDIKIDNSNNIFVTGFYQYALSPNSFAILKYDSSGNLQKVIKNGNQFANVFSPVAMTVNKNGDITATGSCLQSGNPYATDYFTVRYSSSIGINEISNATPSNYKLYQNYPNPFNPVTIINYELRITGLVQIQVFDVLGNEVFSLVNKNQKAGSYQVEFNGSSLSSGVYFYKLQAGKYSDTRRMILLK